MLAVLVRTFEKIVQFIVMVYLSATLLSVNSFMHHYRWSKNGKEFEIAFRLDTKFSSPHAALHPAVLVQNSSLELNFGDTPFAFPPKEVREMVVRKKS